jgi:phosphoribosyl 1,2-cyclic phosphodiesterase
MNIRFWGVRGSIPTPGKSFVKYGGNTSCVEINAGKNTIILDMGSGLVNLGTYLIKKNIKNFDILVSHFHYDHTCGLPFFMPAYNKEFSFSIRSGLSKNRKKTLDVLKKQISSPSFPITIDKFMANIIYDDFEIEKEFLIQDNIKVKTISLNHPDGATGYRIENKNKSVCYITDHEHELSKKNEKLMSFLWKSDVLIYDSTYDDNNFKDYIGWGHSTWQEATRLAQACKIKNLFIFHHNPENNDKVLDAIQSKCSNINERYIVAQEDMFFKLT